MYITVMDFSTETITKLVLDVEKKPQTEEVLEEHMDERYYLSDAAIASDAIGYAESLIKKLDETSY